MPSRRYSPKILGSSGEQRAAAWYVSRGFVLRNQNWRCRHGEIDLIVEGSGYVVFVEVKTRANDRYGSPFEAVDQRKQRKLRTLAAVWLAENPSPRQRDVRFDVVAVVGTNVEVRTSAF